MGYKHFYQVLESESSSHVSEERFISTYAAFKIVFVQISVLKYISGLSPSLLSLLSYNSSHSLYSGFWSGNFFRSAEKNFVGIKLHWPLTLGPVILVRVKSARVTAIWIGDMRCMKLSICMTENNFLVTNICVLSLVFLLITMNLNDGLGMTDVYGMGKWLRRREGVFKKRSSDLKDGAVQYPPR